MTTKSMGVFWLCLAAGCSEVQIEPADATGGRGGSDDVASSTTSQASSSTGADREPIDVFCESVGDCVFGCAQAFQSFQHPPCEEEGLALTSCLVDAYDAETCSVDGCAAETAALAHCRSTTAFSCNTPASPGGIDHTNHCTTFAYCAGGDYLALCAYDGTDLDCDCFLNGLLMGSCVAPPTQDESGDLECISLRSGCCASMLGSCADCP